jgi:hypothetical protein
VITPVYAGTDVGQLRELSDSLAAQSTPVHEWLLAADGPVPDEVRAYLTGRTADDARVRFLDHDAKRGILTTMRACLRAATADVVTPVDADDLLVPVALSRIVDRFDAAARPRIVFSDEDIVDEGGPRDPYLRPDWDPVLHTASSYIWHLIAYDRRTAIDLDLYGDPGTEWCHDWDTVDRFAAAGHSPAHVAEVLYHWRRHESSSTNTAVPTTAQRSSVHHLLDRIARRTGNNHRYHVGPFPIDRGAPELHIRRLPIDGPDVTVLVGTVNGSSPPSLLRSLHRTLNFPVREIRDCILDTVGALARQLADVGTSTVVIVDAAVDIRRPDWLWEAVKHLELHGDTGIVCGRIVDDRGRLVDGAAVVGPGGTLGSPLRGLAPADPGPFALALKPQTVDGVQPQLMVARTDALRDVLATVPAIDSLRDAGASLGAACAQQGRRVVYTPLLEAASVTAVGAPVPDASTAFPPGRRGMAGFGARGVCFR